MVVDSTLLQMTHKKKDIEVKTDKVVVRARGWRGGDLSKQSRGYP